MAAVSTSPVSPSTLHTHDDPKAEPSQPHATSQVHTPPTTDEASHKDDDGASSSSLSDIDENADLDVDMRDFEEEQNRQRFEDAARAGAEAEQHAQIKPHHYEGGIPVFEPTMDEFRDFQAFMRQADAYGMQSGIIKIVPPAEWKAARKALDDLVKHIKIKNPITQEFHGAQGIWTQRNMERMRSYNLPQWKAVCESTENQPPARRGEKRMNADRLLGRGATKKKTESSPAPEGGKRRGRPPKNKKESTAEPESSLAAPPTPTSPESRPVTIKTEEVDDQPAKHEGTPSKGKPGRKPRGRQPKTTTKKEAGTKSTETTVAARRLRNAREAVDFVDEEAFEGFDYRVYDNDQWTQERCDELEDKYWKSLSFSNPMYAADMPGSLFDEETTSWNVAKLPNLLDWLGAPIPGVNTAYLYLGMWRATFAWHLEDVDLYSINYIHFGAPKQWYSISQKDAPKFENAMKALWPSDAKNCDQFLRHKTYLVSPSILKSRYGVNVNRIVHREGEFIVTFPIGYHSGYNLGYNCAESVNFAIENWLQYGKTARKCQCESDSVFIDVDWFIRRMNGEPTPEYEEVEITDYEDDDDVGDLPTPPGSDHGKIKAGQKRKRGAKDLGPNKKAKKIVKIRKVSRNQPCCLCPNDFAWEELLPTDNGHRAHRVCAMYTPETYIATEDGNEKVFNVENISKARLDLRCHECKQKKGSCFQCSSAKCTRAYHATCAMHAGVQVDKGEIAIWHEGVEYKDVGFDWRCRLHRTVKRTRITSELSALNHATNWLNNKELHEYVSKLQPGDVIQWQATNGDEIQAGVVVSAFDAGQNSVLVSALPEQKLLREIDPAHVLFVDSSTSCLQRPSANALELPEELQGTTASVPGSTEKKPSEGDPFTEDPKTEWAEFVSEMPPHNKWQKKVDFSKEKQIFYFLGKTSTDTKAQYTADPDKQVYDPASNFLDTVEPPKMAPPPQPKRQFFSASYPQVQFAARNNAMDTMRQHAASQSPQISRPPLTPKTDAVMNAARDKVVEMERNGQPTTSSAYKDLLAAAEARVNQEARIMQRQQAQAKQFGNQDDKTSNGMNMDQQGTGGQRRFSQSSFESPNVHQSQYQPHAQAQQQSYSNNPTMPPFRQYHEPLTNYYTQDAAIRYPSPVMNNFRPQPFQYSSDWMNPHHSNRPMPFSHLQSPALPTMGSDSPQLMYKSPVPPSQSPTTNPAPSTFSPYHQSGENPFLGVSAAGHQVSGTDNPMRNPPMLKREASSIESARTNASSLPPPRTPTETQRQRRNTNPSYPFKSPEQIVAQKEEREKNGSQSSGSRPVSRPGSGYSTAAFPSPGLATIPYGPEPGPPMYINPNATQISPPRTGGGTRTKSASVSAGVGNMGPPSQVQMPSFRRSYSSNNMVPMILDGFKPVMSGLTQPFAPLLPTTSHFSSTALNQSIASSSNAYRPMTPLAEPAPLLVESLSPRPIHSDGTPRNDRHLPATVVKWQENPGFWNKVSAYFAKKHDAGATVYKSPYGHGSSGFKTASGLSLLMGPSGIGNDEGLAGRYHARLDDNEREKVDEYKREHPMGMRP